MAARSGGAVRVRARRAGSALAFHPAQRRTCGGGLARLSAQLCQHALLERDQLFFKHNAENDEREGGEEESVKSMHGFEHGKKPPGEHSFLISDIIIADSPQMSRQMFRNFRFRVRLKGLSEKQSVFSAFLPFLCGLYSISCAHPAEQNRAARARLSKMFDTICAFCHKRKAAKRVKSL
jgi:hypothetical protein